MSLNLEKQLLFYGAYHHDPRNVAIHMTCVPMLLATGLILFTNTPNIVPLPANLQIPYLPPNMGTIGSFIYSGLYILMEPVAGAMLTPFIVGSAALGNYVVPKYGMDANYVAIGVHVVSWIAQFIGHGHYEGRAPALLDNLVQALFLAPLFVWLEFLFKLGYRPELKKRLDIGVEKEIAKFRKEKKAVANGKTK